jgi:hypothetical protein
LPSEEQILDCSKANTVPRVITLAQVPWVLVQVIGRLAHRLPISKLEMVTVAYIFCDAVTFISWWNKPLDIPASRTALATYQCTEWPERRREYDGWFEAIATSDDHRSTLLILLIFFATF